MTRQDIIDKYAAIPPDLKELKIWACWSGRGESPDIDTTACDPKAEDPTIVEPPEDWCSFDEAVDGCVLNGFAGIGISLPLPYRCITVVNGAGTDECAEIVDDLDSYAETATDGHSVQVIVKAVGGDDERTVKHPEISKGFAVSVSRSGFVPLTGACIHGAGSRLVDMSVASDSVAKKYASTGGVYVASGSSEYDMTDTGNARRLRDMYGDRIRYSHTMKEWYVWDGKRWAPNDAGQIKQLADNVIGAMRHEAAKMQDEKARATVLKFIRKTEGHVNKENMLKESQHLEGIPVTMDELDNDERTEGLLNVGNGIVNLRTGELMPHDRSLMMTKVCGTDYDTAHGTPTAFLKFLEDVTNGDEEMMAYLKRCVGYTLTGSASERCAFFLYGMGCNGKSTFTDIVSEALGSYAANTQADTLLLKGREIGGSGASGDIARLKSIRMATCQEPDEGARIKEGLLKQLTGGTDKVTARFLYGREFEFLPKFAAWICTNHKPIVRGTDNGIWDRIRLIPFEVTIAKDKIDRDLPRKLRKELPQILAWAVEGAMEWYEHGLQTPAAVSNATAEYKKEMDLVASFADACLEIDYNSTDKIMASDMFAVYIAWAKANNEYEMSAKKFGMELTKKIPDGKGRDKAGVYYSKIRFTEYGRSFVQKKYTADQFH